MSSLTLELLLIACLIVLNGLLAMSEFAVVSAQRARLQRWANEGNRRARLALDLAGHPNRFLITIQIGITLIAVLSGALGGATVAERLASELREGTALAAYAQPLALGVVVVLLTYFNLVGELVPKRIALAHAERLAVLVAAPMQALSVVAAPAVWLLSHSIEGVLRLLRIRPSGEPPVTQEEIRLMVEEGTRAGVFQESELDMVEGVLRMDQRRVSGLMTPRPDISWLDLEDDPAVLQQALLDSRFSSLPVARGSLDDIAGLARTKDLLAGLLRGADLPHALRSCLTPPLYVPETMPALQVLESFRDSGTHLALVVDEYGTVQGLITPTDLLESIVGDLPAAGEAYEPEAVQREDGSWLLDGMLPLEEFKDLLGLPAVPGEERGQYHTLGGFIMARLGRIPAAADRFEWDRLQIEVMDMDGHRVDKVLVTPRPPDLSDES